MTLEITDLVGKRFGELTVVTLLSGKSKWLCKCGCGKERIAWSNDLLKGRLSSCGCGKNRLFGIGKDGRSNHRLHNVWSHIISKKNSSISDGRGKGKIICERWKDFWKFVEDMDGTSLRIPETLYCRGCTLIQKTRERSSKEALSRKLCGPGRNRGNHEMIFTTIPVKLMTSKFEILKDFFLSGKRNEWIFFPDGKVYLRVSYRFVKGEYVKSFDIATVEANVMKQGFLRSVLEAMELVVKENGAIVYVENVLLKWLEEYLEDRRKYERYFLPGCSVGFGDANFIYNFESSKKLDYKDCSKGFS